MKCVILAAGKGERLLPITENMPKHMIPVGGIPLLERIIECLKDNHITHLIVIVGYRKKDIVEYFKDGSHYGVKIEYISQEKPMGTADSIRLVEQSTGDEDFLIIYGDLHIRNRTIERVLNEYNKTSESVIGIKSFNRTSDYGSIKVEDDYIKEIIEKSSNVAKNNIINTGIYVFKKELFEFIKKTKKSKRGEYELTDSLNLAIQDNIKIRAALLDGEVWMDIGYPWNLLDANEDALKEINNNIEGIVEKNVQLIGPVILNKDAKILSGSRIEGPVFIGRRSTIGPNSHIRPHTSIGSDVKIGNSCEIKNSLIMDRTKIPHLSYIGDSIICSGCNIGAGTTTGNIRMDGKTIKVKIKNDIINSHRRKLGTIMGDNVRTSVNVNFMPGVKIGSNAFIGPNVVVYKDVLSREKVLLQQELIRKKMQQ